jgi:hypothetical protein
VSAVYEEAGDDAIVVTKILDGVVNLKEISGDHREVSILRQLEILLNFLFLRH